MPGAIFDLDLHANVQRDVANIAAYISEIEARSIDKMRGLQPAQISREVARRAFESAQNLVDTAEDLDEDYSFSGLSHGAADKLWKSVNHLHTDAVMGGYAQRGFPRSIVPGGSEERPLHGSDAWAPKNVQSAAPQHAAPRVRNSVVGSDQHQSTDLGEAGLIEASSPSRRPAKPPAAPSVRTKAPVSPYAGFSSPGFVDTRPEWDPESDRRDRQKDRREEVSVRPRPPCPVSRRSGV